MCVPPVNLEPSPYFLLMRNIKYNIEKELKIPIKISMGMSQDYQKAIALGSNEIRIGSAIMGMRD